MESEVSPYGPKTGTYLKLRWFITAVFEARENELIRCRESWIQRALANLGHEIARSTIAEILERRGISGAGAERPGRNFGAGIGN